MKWRDPFGMSFLLRTLLPVLSLVITAFWTGCPTDVDDDDDHTTDDDSASDDDYGDDDLGDDDSGGDCSWQGAYVGAGMLFEKDPWGDFTWWDDLECWGQVDSDCILSGELDLPGTPVDEPANLGGEVDTDGAAQGWIIGTFHSGEKVSWEWIGQAEGTTIHGDWQDKNQDGLYLHGGFTLTKSE